MAVVMKYFIRSVAHDFAAPGQYAGLCPGGFRLLNLVIPNVEERKAGPGELIVWPEFDRLFTRLDGFREISIFHQRHAECMPSVEKGRKLFNASPVLLDCSRQLADGQIAVRIVKKLFNFRWDFVHSYFSS